MTEIPKHYCSTFGKLMGFPAIIDGLSICYFTAIIELILLRTLGTVQCFGVVLLYRIAIYNTSTIPLHTSLVSFISTPSNLMRPHG